MDGASNILSLPDFARSEDMSGIFKIMEEKQILANLLESEMKACADCGAILDEEDPTIKKSGSKESRMMLHHKGQGRVHVCIGSENPIKSLHNLSVVSSTYQLSDKTVGVLGILGPKRMEYSKMIALVDYMSQMMNRLLRDLNEK
jgi:transcriptional regulator of heat shock response